MSWESKPPTEAGIYHVRHHGVESVASFDATRPMTWSFFGDESRKLASTLSMTGFEWWDEAIEPVQEDSKPWTFEATATKTTRLEAVVEVTRLLDKWSARVRAEFGFDPRKVQ